MPRGRTARAPFDLVLREGDEIVPLTRRGHYLLLSSDGLYLGNDRYAQSARFVPWESVTHLSVGKRSLWLGTTTTVRPILHGRRTPVDFRDVAQRIERRIARRPGGIAQLSRMREIDERARRAPAPLVAVTVVLVCIAVHALQISDEFVSDVGEFARELVAQGELWRIVTPHFLHDVSWFFVTPESAGGLPLLLRVPGHIALNSALALLLGYLVEPALGRTRAIFVLAMSAVGAVTVSALATPVHVVGASGMVLGLAGAVLALEVSVPDRLPASWRIPRTLLIAVLLLELVYGFRVEFIAGWAHLGGLLGGYLAARLVARGAFGPATAGGWLRPVAWVALASVVLSFAAAAPLVRRVAWAFDRHASNVLALDEVGAMKLNNLAWRMATETRGLPEFAPRALALAERAVAETERANPDYLDTLAEVQFLAGDADAAVVTIDEAIEIAPWDDYFREQRDRFTGARAADDRPESPSLPWFLRGPDEAAPWDDGRGLEI